MHSWSTFRMSRAVTSPFEGSSARTAKNWSEANMSELIRRRELKPLLGGSSITTSSQTIEAQCRPLAIRQWVDQITSRSEFVSHKKAEPRPGKGLRSGLAGVTNQSLLGKKLEGAVALHVDGVSEVIVDCRKHGDDRSALVIIGCVLDPLSNGEL